MFLLSTGYDAAVCDNFRALRHSIPNYNRDASRQFQIRSYARGIKVFCASFPY